MNQKIEKWLTVCALGSWVASIGAMIAIEVFSSQPLYATSQLPKSLQISGLNEAPHATSEQAILGLSSHSHWLDRTLLSDRSLDVRFPGSEEKTVQTEISASADRVRPLAGNSKRSDR